MAVVHALLPLVGGWIQDALFVQSLYVPKTPRAAADEPVENIADNGGSRFVDQQTAVSLR